VLAWIARGDEDRAIEAFHAHPLGREAAVIGRVEAHRDAAAPVVIRSAYGVDRPLDMLSGSEVPRIC
jgi:hydrogenase expression/formation protein HypE